MGGFRPQLGQGVKDSHNIYSQNKTLAQKWGETGSYFSVGLFL